MSLTCSHLLSLLDDTSRSVMMVLLSSCPVLKVHLVYSQGVFASGYGSDLK